MPSWTSVSCVAQDVIVSGDIGAPTAVRLTAKDWCLDGNDCG